MKSSFTIPEEKPFRARIGIVDDESSSIDSLKSLIEENYPEVIVAFIAKTLEETRIMLGNEKIDILFLDVQLGDGTGFDLLPELDDKIRVVFATGYDQYAVRAFEVNALDYILKPIQLDRLERVMQMYSDEEKRNRTLPPIRSDDDILLQDNGVADLVPIKSIQYIESDKDYTKVYTKKRNWFIRKSLNHWEETLPATMFLRIHRSIVVNMEHVETVQKTTTGCFQVSLNNLNKTLTSSRRYANRLKRFYI